jgi:hypothetical protein
MNLNIINFLNKRQNNKDIVYFFTDNNIFINYKKRVFQKEERI